MMTLHSISRIRIVCSINSFSYIMKLKFDKVPTDEQLVEATRCMLFELNNCSKEEALQIMEAVKETGVPDKNNFGGYKNVSIFHEKDFLFKIHKE